MFPLLMPVLVTAMLAIGVPVLIFTAAPAAAPVLFGLGGLMLFWLLRHVARLDKVRFGAVLAAGACLALLLTPHAALAQSAGTTTSTGTVSLAPLVDQASGFISAALGVVAMAAIGWLSARLNGWIGISIDAGHRDALHSALMTGVNAALGKLTATLETKTVNVGSPVVAEAVQYVLAAVPDAVSYFGLDTSHLSEMALAKLQGLLGVAATPAAGTASAS